MTRAATTERSSARLMRSIRRLWKHEFHGRRKRLHGCGAASVLAVGHGAKSQHLERKMSNRLLAGGFQDVDRTGTPEAFAEYLEHIGTDERVRRLNRKRAEAAGIAAGHRVLDVGCGVGFDASLLAELVAPAGKVIGIDHSAAMVERAAARLAGSGLPVEFRTADAHALPFDGGAFDAAWTERVLVHVTDPAQVVREMIRVVRPGGTVVIAEADYHAYVIDSLDPAVAQQVVARHARG